MHGLLTKGSGLSWIYYLVLFVFSLLPLYGQPSGGPYGPIHQTYELPKARRIYFVAPDGKDEAPGTDLDHPTTLQAAIWRASTGDAIVLRGGTYRIGGLQINQGITIQPYADEQPVLKGTLVATDWQALPNNVWRTSWKTLFPAGPLGWWRREREGMKTPLHRFNNDMVFVDGVPLQSAGWEGELDGRSYYIDYENGHVYIGIDPKGRLIEITAWDGAIIRTCKPVHGKTNDGKGLVIRGIIFTQYARRAIEVEGKRTFGPMDEPTDEPVGPADPATYGKEVIGTTLEHVTISHCSRVAGYFRGDRLTIRHSLFSDTSTEGVYVIGSSDVLLERNIFRRNNIEQITGYYPAAVKIFNQSHRVTCRDNLVIDNPYSNGIWYDVGNQDGVFVNNWVQDCIDGFFFEISKGAICAGNVFVNCVNGIRVLNSSNVRVYHNTLINSTASFERTNRTATGDLFGWHAATGPDVNQRQGHEFVGNLLAADRHFSRPLLRFDQSRILCGQLREPQVKRLDANIYIRPSNAAGPLIIWSPVAGSDCLIELSTLADLQRLHPEFEVNGRVIHSDLRSIFKSPELGHYQLIRPIQKPGWISAVPSEIRQLLGWTGHDSLIPGAYQMAP